MSPSSSSQSATPVLTSGAWIKARRKYLGLTQDQLAERVGLALERLSEGATRGETCTARTIRRAESARPLSLRIARGLVHALEIPPDDYEAFTNWFLHEPAASPWTPADPRQDLKALHRGSSDHGTGIGKGPPDPLGVPLLPPPAPPLVAQFVGRSTELRALSELMNARHVAVISGIAGVGKSALTATVARQRAPASHIFWYEFHRNDDIFGLLWKLAAFLAVHGYHEPRRLLQAALFQGTPSLARTLCDYVIQLLQDQSYVICLDDAQEVSRDPILVAFVEQLCDAAQTGRPEVMVVTRSPLGGIPAEATLVLEGLHPGDVGTLLKLRKLGRSRALIDTLIQATEGNAQLVMLAIEVLRHKPLTGEITRQLIDTRRIQAFLLDEVDRALTEAERAVMTGIAVLRGYGGTKAAIEAALGGRSIRRELFSLGRRHLVRASEDQQDTQYHLHAMLQIFYYDLLDQDERRRMHRRAGTYYETVAADPLLAARHYVQSGDYARATMLTWRIASRGQTRLLHALLEEFAEHGPDPLPVEIMLVRGDVDTLLGNYDQAEAGFRAALAQLDLQPNTPATRELKARACRGLGELLEFDSPQQALSWLRRGLEQVAGTSVLEEGILHVRIGSVLIAMGNLPDARHAIETSLRLLPSEAGHWRARALVKQGVLHCALDEFAAGLTSYQAALDLYNLLGDRWGMIAVWHNLGIVKHLQGDWTGADREYGAALQTARELGSVVRQVDVELCLGALRTAQGAFDLATTQLAHALALAREHRLHEQIIHIQSNRADLALRTRDLAAATAAIQEAEQLTLEIGSDYQLPEIRRTQALIALDQGRLDEAWAHAEAAVRLAREQSSTRDEAIGLRVQGQVLQALGEHDRALEAFADAHALIQGSDPYETACVECCWGQALLVADPRQRRVLLDQALATFRKVGAAHDRSLVEDLLHAQ